ncbi:hypothetical protein Tsubulata_023845, partial [Turnera subulata]
MLAKKRFMAIFFLYLLLFLVLHTITKHFLNKIQSHPPTPFPSLPIIGHLYLLKGPFHRALTKISQRYGPIVTLQFGNLRVLLVSSPKIAEECLGKNDIVFANRPHLFYAKYISDNYTSLVWASYGDHWRNLRKIASLEILSTHRVQMLSTIRQEEIKSLILYLHQNQNQKLNMRTALFELTMNIMMRMIAGKRYYGDSVTNVEEANRFQEIYGELRRVSKEFFIRDLFPWIGSKEIEKKLIEYKRKRDEWIQSLIEEHRQKRKDDLPGERKRNLIQVLLSLQETDPDYYQDELIRNLILVLLTAGTGTSIITMEWTLSLLLNNPEVMKKAQMEIDKCVGHERLIDETDIDRLPYLHSIIKEAMRVYPAAPLLVPHEASKECVVGGFRIPRGTILLVNAWGIQNDPNIWEDPTTFRPERFQETEGTKETLKFLPFGYGRRSCPGEGLALRMVGLALGSLIQCFEWKGVGDKTVDMTEGTGIAVPKVEPLQVVPFLCLPIIGHFYLFKQPLHRTLAQISNRYGPILLLQFGRRPILVVSSPELAEKCLAKNDITFANRPRILYAKHLSYNFTSLIWASYGDHWRNLRRIVSLEILSTHRVQMLSFIRQEEVKSLICLLYRNQNQAVDMRAALFELTLNIIMRMIAGKRYYGNNIGVADVEQAKMFREIQGEIGRLSREAAIGDFFPWIGRKKIEKKLMESHGKRDRLMQCLIEEQRTKRKSDFLGEGQKNLIQVMLSLQEKEPEYYQDELIKSLVVIATKHLLNRIKNLPPSPFLCPPIIGHFYLFKQPLHRTLAEISKRYGPILLLQFGRRPVLVVSSPEIAEECLAKNDIIFANRPKSLFSKHMSYNSTSLVWTSYGDHWRNLRRIASVEILSTHRVQMLSFIRQEEVKSLICHLYRNQNQMVNMRAAFFKLTLNIIMRMIAGKRYYEESSGTAADVEEANRFREILEETTRLSRKSTTRDFFPWMGCKRIEKELMECQRKRDSLMQCLVDEQRKKMDSDLSGERKKNLIQVLLSLQDKDPEYYDDDQSTELSLKSPRDMALWSYSNLVAVACLLSHRRRLLKNALPRTMLSSPTAINHWRNLRRIVSLEILSTNRVQMLSFIRLEEVKSLISHLYRNQNQTVDMRVDLNELTMNIMMRMIAGKRYFGRNVADEEEAKRFTEIRAEAVRLSGESITSKGEKWRLTFPEKRKESDSKDPQYYHDQQIKSLVLELISAGTETTINTMEWTLSLLINHPEVLEKVQLEIDKCVGHDRLIDETNLKQLPYLHSIITEAMRLHPALPLLLPHESSEECTVGGFRIPSGTMLLVNAWALQNEPSIWVDPSEFRPERFEGMEDQEELPRSRAGLKVAGLAMGSLIQCFEWESIGDKIVDMKEGSGFTVPRFEPLK